MKVYKVLFTPAEPWFFGNEKNFLFPNQSSSGSYSNSYFIKSEQMPSQSAVLGALRYIFIPVKKVKNKYNEQDFENNKKLIGGESFNIDSATTQEFGKIKKISPVFIVRDGKELIPAPLDHKNKFYNDESKENETNDFYTPFKEYKVCMTNKDYMLTAADYVAKDELASGFVSLADGKFYKTSDIFGSEDRVGINRADRKGGLFKKQYCFFRKVTKNTKSKKTDTHEYSFAVYAVIDDDKLDGGIFDVTMGQGKSPFSVSFEEVCDADRLKDGKSPIENHAEDFLKEKHCKLVFSDEQQKIETGKCKLIYCLSDAVISTPYDKTVFAATKTKDYRAFLSKPNGIVEKGEKLHRLIKAGSVFISTTADEWVNSIKNENVEQIGFNNFVVINIGGKTNEQDF